MKTASLHALVSNAFAAGYEKACADRDPQGDSVSMRRAIAVFGKAWVERNLADGRIHAHRSSDAPNAKFYLSMAEMRILKNKEKICYIINKENLI